MPKALQQPPGGFHQLCDTQMATSIPQKINTPKPNLRSVGWGRYNLLSYTSFRSKPPRPMPSFFIWILDSSHLTPRARNFASRVAEGIVRGSGSKLRGSCSMEVEEEEEERSSSSSSSSSRKHMCKYNGRQEGQTLKLAKQSFSYECRLTESAISSQEYLPYVMWSAAWPRKRRVYPTLRHASSTSSPTWTPKVCKITALVAVIMGLGLLFYIRLGLRPEH